MKRSIYSFRVALFCMAAIIAIIPNVSGKTITPDVAQVVARNFIQQKASMQVTTQSLAYTAIASSGDAVYYAFNTNAKDGFVIVVADDAQYPVIGYSTEGKFVVPDASSNAGYWMEKRKNEIIANRARNIQPTADISALWTAYLNNQQVAERTTSGVTPFVQTLWDQPSPYNALCPGGSVTGCVATAMAQIMRYWSYPAKGSGSSSYNSSYGTLSSNYGDSTYNWAAMPTGNVESANAYVASLMLQCGISVNMEYSPSGSGAWVTTYDDPSVCAQVSYSKYFGYNSETIKGLQRFNYNDADWISVIEADLNASRPVQYVGYDPNAGGHTWVCDGYDSDNNLHMNWGWSGADNGFYSINSLNPGGYDFSDGHEAVVGIEPIASVPIDAGILSVTSPSGTTCNASVTPVVQLENFGSSTLSSCTINYYYDSNAAQTYGWTGSLATGAYKSVTLPAMSVTSGTHSFTSYTSNPNGKADGNTANNQSTGSFTIATAPQVLPITEGFEGSSLLPAGWSRWNSNDDAEWQLVTTVAHTGTNCVGINNCDGAGSTDMTGSINRLITLPYSFVGEMTASLAFDVAYAPCTLSGVVYADTLAVYYSFDCGSTWTICYLKGGATLATAPTFEVDANSGCFSPADSSQWRTDVIDLTSISGQPSVMFAFENRSGWGEWIYVDNINISGTTITGVASIPSSESFRIYPNPANTLFTIEGPGSMETTHYSLYNVIGEELITGDIATDGNHFQQNIPVSDLAHGIYLLRVSDNEHSWTTKVDVR